MPNKNSKADHTPIRTCVICKKKIDQNLLLNFCLMNGSIVYDIKRVIPVRKYYVCPAEPCLVAIDKWLARRQKRSASTPKPVQK